MEHTQRLLGSTYSLVELVPLKKATNGAFTYVDLQVTRQEESSHEVELDACELGEFLADIE